MSTERFLEAMTAETRRQCTAIIEASQNTAAERIAAANAAAAERRREALEALAVRHTRLEAQTRDQATAEASRNTFMVRNVLVNESIAAAHERLIKIAESTDFTETILLLLQESLPLADEPVPITVRVPALFQDTVTEYLKRNGFHDVQVVSQDAPVDGVVLQANDGSFRVYNTLTLRLKQNMKKASALAYRRFFGAQESQ